MFFNLTEKPVSLGTKKEAMSHRAAAERVTHFGWVPNEKTHQGPLMHCLLRFVCRQCGTLDAQLARSEFVSLQARIQDFLSERRIEGKKYDFFAIGTV